MTITHDHHTLGLEDKQLVEMYRLMLMARRMDDRMWALNRQGRAPFVVGSSGHEAIQVASVMALDRDIDWVLPYYRDMGVALAWGMPPVDIFLGTFARGTDPMSGGRQLPTTGQTRNGASSLNPRASGPSTPTVPGSPTGSSSRVCPGRWWSTAGRAPPPRVTGTRQ